MPGLHEQAIDDARRSSGCGGGRGRSPRRATAICAVDPRPREPARAQRRQLLLELALAAADDRRQDVDALVGGESSSTRSTICSSDCDGDLPAALGAVRDADVGEEQAQVVVDLGDRADGRARVRGGGLLLDGDRRREAVDEIDVRLLHLLEELAGVGRQRLDVAPLPLGVDRVEGERRLPRPGQAGDDHQPVPRAGRRRCSSGCGRERRERRSSRDPCARMAPDRGPQTANCTTPRIIARGSTR